MAVSRSPGSKPRVKSRTSAAPPGRPVAASPVPDAPTPPASRAGSSSVPSGLLGGPLAAALVSASNAALNGHSRAKDATAAPTFAVIWTALLALTRLLEVYTTPEGERLRERAHALGALVTSPGKDAAAAARALAYSPTWADPAGAAVPTTPPRLDWQNPRDVASWVADMREQIADIIAAGLDATAPPGMRELGRRSARRQITDAKRKIGDLFTLARLDPKDRAP